MTFRLDRYLGKVVLIFMLLMPLWLWGQKYQTHTVRRGDTLFALSRQYGVSVDQLKEINSLSNSNLSIGQVLKIKRLQEDPPPSPRPASLSEASALAQVPEIIVNPDAAYYVVKPKDNLYRIAVAHKLKVADLILWNGFADENQLIKAGDRILVKDPQSLPAVNETAADSQPQTETKPLAQIVAAPADTSFVQRVYIVQRKDTLFKIATENGMTVEDLKKINNLTSNDISVGQKLNLVTPRGRIPSTSVRPGLTEAEVRSKDKIRTDLVMPVEGKVLSEFGIRNGRPHKGIDIGAKAGTPIYAVLSGTVVFAGYQGAYGNVIVLEHPDFVMTVYSHNEQNLVNVGDTVNQGQQIATVGSTGNATGAHLHFEYRIKGKAIDPRKVLPF